MMETYLNMLAGIFAIVLGMVGFGKYLINKNPDKKKEFIIICSLIGIIFILGMLCFVFVAEKCGKRDDKTPTPTVTKTASPTPENPDDYSLGVVFTKGEEKIRIAFTELCENYTDKTGKKINLFVDGSDNGPFDNKMLPDELKEPNGPYPVLYIADVYDIENNAKFKDIDIQIFGNKNAKLILKNGEAYEEETNIDGKSLPFIREGFSFVYKDNLYSLDSLSFDEFDSFTNNRLFMINKSWLYSNHFFSIYRISNDRELVCDLFNKMLDKTNINTRGNVSKFDSGKSDFGFMGTWDEGSLSNQHNYSFMPIPLRYSNNKIIVGATKHLGILENNNIDEAISFVNEIINTNSFEKIGLVCALKDENTVLDELKKLSENGIKYPLTLSMMEYFIEGNVYPYIPKSREELQELTNVSEKISRILNSNDPSMRIKPEDVI